MKVFISWSGELSRQVALVLRDWLPSVIQSVEPYVSSEDIDKGSRWLSDISKELDESYFGILCVTHESINAPWLNFEAGALSKSFDRSHVIPFLLGVKRSEIQGPLLQFQSVIFKKDDVKKLVLSINNALVENKLEKERLQKIFDVWWANLEKELRELESAATSSKPSEEKVRTIAPSDEEILEEILDLVRRQQRIISNPERLLPPGYLEMIVTEGVERKIDPDAFRDLFTAWFDLLELLDIHQEDGTIPVRSLSGVLVRLEKPLEHIYEQLGPKLAGRRFRGVQIEQLSFAETLRETRKKAKNISDELE